MKRNVVSSTRKFMSILSLEIKRDFPVAAAIEFVDSWGIHCKTLEKIQIAYVSNFFAVTSRTALHNCCMVLGNSNSGTAGSNSDMWSWFCIGTDCNDTNQTLIASDPRQGAVADCSQQHLGEIWHKILFKFYTASKLTNPWSWDNIEKQIVTELVGNYSQLPHRLLPVHVCLR